MRRRRQRWVRRGNSSKDGLTHLEQALALLDDVCVLGSGHDAEIAENLAGTYMRKLCARITAHVSSDPALPEPTLEHFFRLLLAFDQCSAELPPSARAMKIEIVRKLIDRYYEGHSAEDKQRALDQLAGIVEP